MGMTRQHLELVADVLRTTHATPTTVYAMADRFASESGGAVTQHYDRSRFIAAAMPDPDQADTISVVVETGNAAFRHEDDELAYSPLRETLYAALKCSPDLNDERPILDPNGNRVGRVERY